MKKSEAFRDFLLENSTALDETDITNSTCLLNHFNLQGEKLEGESDIELPEEDPSGCYDMGTCGFLDSSFLH